MGRAQRNGPPPEINAADRCAIGHPQRPQQRGQRPEKCQKGRRGAVWELGIAWWRCFVARGGHPIGCTITDRAAAAKAGDTYLPGRSERCSLPTEGQEPDVSTDGAPRFALARALEARRRDGINRALTGFPYVTGTQRSCTLQVAASSLSLSLLSLSPLLSRLSRPRREEGGGRKISLYGRPVRQEAGGAASSQACSEWRKGLCLRLEPRSAPPSQLDQ